MLGLLLASTLVATTGRATLAPGTYTYNATMTGAKIGTSVLTVQSINGRTVIAERASGDYGGNGASATATLTLDADLAPLSYALSGTTNGSSVQDSAKIVNATADVVNVHGQNQAFDLLASTKHFVIIDLGAFAGFFPLPAQMRAWNDDAVLAVVPSIGLTAALVPSIATPPSRPPTVPAGDQSLTFDGQAPFTIWYDPATNVPDEIDVTAQGVVVTRQR